MKIVHLETAYTGMGNAVIRLHEMLLNNGYDSVVLNQESAIVNDTILEIKRNNKIKGYFNRKFCGLSLLGKLSNSYYYSPDALFRFNIIRNQEVKDADCICLHWTHGLFLNLGDIEDLCKLEKPVVIFFHDKWYMTGGCNHNFECRGFLNDCKNCPMFKWKKLSPYIQFSRKKNLYTKYRNLYFVNFSHWMDRCFMETGIYQGNNHFVISPLIDDTVFHPIQKEYARKELNLPANKEYISFGSVSSLTNEYKGAPFLFDAIKKLKKRRNIHLIMFGSEKKIDIGIPYTSFGIVKDEHLMSLVNSASDVYVAPSLAESYGMAVMENLLCGTPVVAFKTASMPELVEDKQNGYLAEYKNSQDLCQGINYVLDNIRENNFKMPDYSTKRESDAYIRFFNSLKIKD